MKQQTKIQHLIDAFPELTRTDAELILEDAHGNLDEAMELALERKPKWTNTNTAAGLPKKKKITEVTESHTYGRGGRGGGRGRGRNDYGDDERERAPRRGGERKPRQYKDQTKEPTPTPAPQSHEPQAVMVGQSGSSNVRSGMSFAEMVKRKPEPPQPQQTTSAEEDNHNNENNNNETSNDNKRNDQLVEDKNETQEDVVAEVAVTLASADNGQYAAIQQEYVVTDAPVPPAATGTEAPQQQPRPKKQRKMKERERVEIRAFDRAPALDFPKGFPGPDGAPSSGTVFFDGEPGMPPRPVIPHVMHTAQMFEGWNLQMPPQQAQPQQQQPPQQQPQQQPHHQATAAGRYPPSQPQSWGHRQQEAGNRFSDNSWPQQPRLVNNRGAFDHANAFGRGQIPQNSMPQQPFYAQQPQAQQQVQRPGETMSNGFTASSTTTASRFW